MRRRMAFCLSVLGMFCQAELLAAEPAQAPPIQGAVRWLEGKSRELIRASRQTMKSGIAAFPPQAGRGYDAFWLRDYAYMLEGCPEAFSDRELRDACKLFVDSLAADGAGVDCVKFDGTPIYKPGYGTMGENPVADGGPFTVAVAWHTHRRLQDRKFVAQIIDRLIKAMEAAPRNPQTGMVHIRPQGWDRCPYGFTDSVRKQGDELFTSLLWVEAARRLADLLIVATRQEAAGRWRTEADRVAAGLPGVFWDDKLGLFRAATLRCRQPDLWGSAFAVYLGVANREQSIRIARYFKDHYAEIVQHGQLRHLPGGMYWEAACGRDTYQNGGYWATPAGWLVYTLDLVDSKLADQTLLDLVEDFQKRGVTEWVRGDHTAVKNYTASATMPLAGARRMLARRSEANWAQPRQVSGLPNLHKVSDNLYRCAQPSAEGFKNLGPLGIKTVVNLRSFHSDDGIMGDAAIHYEHIAMKAWHPEEEDVVRFLRIVTDPKRAPVLVHCQHGADRTETMCAIYRIVVQGWSKE